VAAQLARLGAANVTITAFPDHPGQVSKIQAKGEKLQVTGKHYTGTYNVTATIDVSAAIRTADMIILSAPGPAFPAYVKALKEHGDVHKNQDLVVIAGSGFCLNYWKEFRDAPFRRIIETNESPFATKFEGNGVIDINLVKRQLKVSVFPVGPTAVPADIQGLFNGIMGNVTLQHVAPIQMATHSNWLVHLVPTLYNLGRLEDPKGARTSVEEEAYLGFLIRFGTILDLSPQEVTTFEAFVRKLVKGAYEEKEKVEYLRSLATIMARKDSFDAHTAYGVFLGHIAEKYFHYAQGITSVVSWVMEDIDLERQALLKSLGLPAASLLDDNNSDYNTHYLTNREYALALGRKYAKPTGAFTRYITGEIPALQTLVAMQKVQGVSAKQSISHLDLAIRYVRITRERLIKNMGEQEFVNQYGDISLEFSMPTYTHEDFIACGAKIST